MNEAAYLTEALAKIERLRGDTSPQAQRELALMTTLMPLFIPSETSATDEIDPGAYTLECGFQRSRTVIST